MGRGNVCVTGKYEGLYYIDHDYTTVYRRNDDDEECILAADLSFKEMTSGEWHLDEYSSIEEAGDVLDCFIEDFRSKFHSFKLPKEGSACNSRKSGNILLENKLFCIVIEDNEWSDAIMLLQKEDPYDDHLSGLQKRHYQKYLEGMKDALLNRLPSIGCYAGAWTSGVITRESQEV